MLGDYEFGENARSYLDKMAQLCRENDIELVLIKAPSLYPYWYDEWEEQVERFAEENGLRYLNFLELVEETDLDFSTDTYDAGLHLNLSGAEKVTRYLGRFLREQCGLEDRRGEEHLARRWEEKGTAYSRDRDEQYRALELKAGTDQPEKQEDS